MRPPRGLKELLSDLADGEGGFGGSSVHTGESTIDEYLRRCIDMSDPTKAEPGLVPQTTYWVLDESDEAIGIVRLRHYLSDKLRVRGGHCGYYIRSDKRGKGYGKTMLGLALERLKDLGEHRALITTDSENASSVRIIEANGGRFTEVGIDPKRGVEYRRYWIDLEFSQS